MKFNKLQIYCARYVIGFCLFNSSSLWMNHSMMMMMMMCGISLLWNDFIEKFTPSLKFNMMMVSIYWFEINCLGNVGGGPSEFALYWKFIDLSSSFLFFSFSTVNHRRMSIDNNNTKKYIYSFFGREFIVCCLMILN